jgi:hypothetical protein
MSLQKIISSQCGGPSNVKRCIEHAQDYSGQLRGPADSEKGGGGQGAQCPPTPILAEIQKQNLLHQKTLYY